MLPVLSVMYEKHEDFLHISVDLCNVKSTGYISVFHGFCATDLMDVLHSKRDRGGELVTYFRLRSHCKSSAGAVKLPPTLGWSRCTCSADIFRLTVQRLCTDMYQDYIGQSPLVQRCINFFYNFNRHQFVTANVIHCEMGAS